MNLCACIGCGTAAPQTPVCPHEQSIWLRVEPYEHVGVCRGCPGFVAIWDAGHLTPELVATAKSAIPEEKDAAPADPSKIAPRINTRIRWFALNSFTEKPV